MPGRRAPPGPAGVIRACWVPETKMKTSDLPPASIRSYVTMVVARSIRGFLSRTVGVCERFATFAPFGSDR